MEKQTCVLSMASDNGKIQGRHWRRGGRSKLRFRAGGSWPVGEGAEWSCFIIVHV